jgi:hypothetical protein
MEKPDDSLDKLIDRALAVYARSEPPSGMDRRILANIARRKAKSQRAMRIAGLALAIILVGTAVYRPIDSSQTETAGAPATPAIAAKVAEPQAVTPPAQEIEAPVVEIAELESTEVEVLIEDESFIADLEAEQEGSLLSDIELEPLTIAALDLPALAR